MRRPPTTMAVFLSWAVLLGAQACGWIALLPSFQGPRCRAWAVTSSPLPPHSYTHPSTQHTHSHSHSHSSLSQCHYCGASPLRRCGVGRGCGSSLSPVLSLLQCTSGGAATTRAATTTTTTGGPSPPVGPSSSSSSSSTNNIMPGAAVPGGSCTALMASPVPPPPPPPPPPLPRTPALVGDGGLHEPLNHTSEPSPCTGEEGGAMAEGGSKVSGLKRLLSGGGGMAGLAVGVALVGAGAASLLGWGGQGASAALEQHRTLTGFDMYWRIFLAGGVCASVSHGWAVPLDVVKTRMQTDPCKYSGGVAAAFRTIMAEEGPNMLLKGLGATLLGYGVQGSLKYGLYALFKNVIATALPHSSIFVNWVLASIGADVLASTALCPMEATRIRLVADPSFAKGTLDGLQRLIATDGPTGVFRGMPAILAKQLPYTIVQLCGFELLTRLFYSWEATASLLGGAAPVQWLVSFASAMITGVFASLASQPGDAILSRVNQQARGESSKPVLLAMADIVRELGLKGLFRGTKARLLHVGLIVTVQLVIYDAVKQMVGLPATGAH